MGGGVLGITIGWGGAQNLFWSAAPLLFKMEEPLAGLHDGHRNVWHAMYTLKVRIEKPSIPLMSYLSS